MKLKHTHTHHTFIHRENRKIIRERKCNHHSLSDLAVTYIRYHPMDDARGRRGCVDCGKVLEFLAYARLKSPVVATQAHFFRAMEVSQDNQLERVQVTASGDTGGRMWGKGCYCFQKEMYGTIWPFKLRVRVTLIKNKN